MARKKSQLKQALLGSDLDESLAEKKPACCFELSRDDLTVVHAALPFLAMAARAEAASADLQLVASRKADELNKNDHLRKQADRAMEIYERLGDHLHHKVIGNGQTR